MALSNEAEHIATELGELECVASVTRGWPTDGTTLPCIAIALAGETPADFRDDDEYLTELEYYLHIFTVTALEGDTVASSVDETMRGMGYTRTFANEQPEQGAAHLIRRYRKTA